jgi:hypothetical protein
MMGRRGCEACGRSFVQKSARQRFCSTTCRSRGHRGGSVVPLRDSMPEPASLVDVTRQALAEVGRESTPAGVSALLLAAKLDLGGDTGSAMAALAKQHLAALEESLRGVPRADDRVDELRARRARRIGTGA